MKKLFYIILVLALCSAVYAGSISTMFNSDIANGIGSKSWSSLSTACTDAITSGDTIIIDKPVYVSSTFTCTAPIRAMKNGIITIAGGKILTLTDFWGDKSTHFAGSGYVKFTNATSWNDHTQVSKVTTVYPEWWSNDIQKAAYAISALYSSSTLTPSYYGGVVKLSPTHYTVTTTLDIPDHVVIEGVSDGSRQSAIVASLISWPSTTYPVIKLGRPLGAQASSHGSQLLNLTIDGNFVSNIGVYSTSAQESSLIKGVWIRNTLLRGIHYENIYASGNDPFIMHTSMKDLHIIFSVATNTVSYPTPTNVYGIEISGSGDSSGRNQFNNFSLDKISVVAAQSGGSNILIGGGFKFHGVSNIQLTNSAHEYAVNGIELGSNSYPVTNVRIENHNGGWSDQNTILISNVSSSNITLSNIQSNQTGTWRILKDDVNSLSITAPFLPHYVFGNSYMIGTNQFWGDSEIGIAHDSNRTKSDLEVDSINKIVYVGRQSSTAGDSSKFRVRSRTGGTSNYSFQIDPTSTTKGLYIGNIISSYTDNAAALAAGLTAGDIYSKSTTSALTIVY